MGVLLFVAHPSRAFTEPVEETRLLTAWSGASLEITPFDTFDVYLKLRVEHGDDDYWIEDGPHRVTGEETVALSVPWPDLSHKGGLLVAPAVVTGFIGVYTLAGENLGVVAIEPRLWFADQPDTTFPQDTLSSSSALVVDAGEALAGAAPEAILAGEAAE
jgi:hypothetical protein